MKELGGPRTAHAPTSRPRSPSSTSSIPVELFNRTFRVIAEERGLSLVEEARLFAMVNIAGADTLINCWSDKEAFSFWRPITAIHEGDNDGNRRTDGDTGWTPFFPPSGTPPYPDHPSGYNCVTRGDDAHRQGPSSAGTG